MARDTSRSSPGLREKLALGLGGVTGFFGFSGPERLAWPVFGMILGIDPWLVGLSLTIPRIWDAVIGPIVGRWSDNARTRFGRRRPFIFVGALAMALSFVALWHGPRGSGDVAAMVYFTGAQLVFFTAYAVFSAPFAALTYEASTDYHGRTGVMTFVGFFHKVGEALGGWMPAALGVATAAVVADVGLAGGGPAGGGEIRIEGVHLVALIVGVVAFGICGTVPALVARERGVTRVAGEPVRVVDGVRAAASNRGFLVLAVLAGLHTVSGVVGSSVDQFVLVYFVHGGDTELGLIQKAVLGTGYTIVGFACIPLLSVLARRMGKRGAMVFVYVLMVVGAGLKWVTFRPSQPMVSVFGVPVDVVMMVDPLLCGPLWVAVKVVMPSMMADVCDDDELRHGQRREALLGSLLSTVEKVMMALAVLVSGGLIALVGFDAGLETPQSEATLLGLRAVFVAVPGGTAVLALVALRWYTLDETRARQTRALLEAASRDGRGGGG